MPDLDTLATQLGAELAAQVQPLLKRLEDETLARIAAATVRDALIDRGGSLILTFGDGTTKDLGVVVGADGKKGPPGKDGVDGIDGKDGLNGLDGAAGSDGKGLDPALGERIENRLCGLEARTVSGALIDRGGDLVLTLADGSNLAAGKVVGRDGIDGKDGLNGSDGKDGDLGPPGLGFDDLDVTLHGDGRTVVVAFMRGDQVKRFEIALPAMVYRGVFEAGRLYAPGDTVTFGGSAWVCNAPTDAKPGETERTWTLAVKRGRDGKDFAGPQVKVGS